MAACARLMAICDVAEEGVVTCCARLSVPTLRTNTVNVTNRAHSFFAAHIFCGATRDFFLQASYLQLETYRSVRFNDQTFSTLPPPKGAAFHPPHPELTCVEPVLHGSILPPPMGAAFHPPHPELTCVEPVLHSSTLPPPMGAAFHPSHPELTCIAQLHPSSSHGCCFPPTTP